MNSTVNPKRIIATNIRTTAEQLDAWRDLYATTYPAHRLSFNAWAIQAIEHGQSAPALRSALQDALESLERLPDVDGAFRVTCIAQARAVLERIDQ